MVSLHDFQKNKRTKGLECPKCGCRHFLTRWTEHYDNEIRRGRACRNCGWQTKTSEQIMEQNDK